MGVGQENVYAMGATQITCGILGASVFPTKITAPNGCIGMDIAYVSGGSVQILPNALSGKTISGATAALTGWPLTATPYSISGPASFYVAWAGSSQAIVSVNFKFSSSGASTLLA